MQTDRIALCLAAHPDDAEFFCAGTLALLRQKGWQIHLATMTPGDCGSMQHTREQISRIRRAEAARSAAILSGQYHCLEGDDAFIMYDRPTLLKAVRLIRRVRPRLVFTLPPDDYMVDHVHTGKLALTACFCGGIPNIETEGVEPFEPIPHLYYLDPAEGKDHFGRAVKPHIIVDISEVIQQKQDMLACHESQRSWLRAHHGTDEYIETMKRLSSRRGRQIGRAYGEGFRQHLGHAFPSDNLLAAELGDRVHELTERLSDA
ncbi:MAG: PIG-L family deacetylase [Sedimentisphaerales bacterium]|nr:PIG-L family deacetylase [Sedimentisphaerales bacterium]